MARKKAEKPEEKKPEKVKFQGFVNIYLNPSDKKQIKENLVSEDEILGFIEKASLGGYKVSTSYSPEGGFFSVTLYGNHPDNPNAGWAMTLRHSDILVAWSALMFSHEYKSVMGDWEGKQGNEGELDW